MKGFITKARLVAMLCILLCVALLACACDSGNVEEQTTAAQTEDKTDTTAPPSENGQKPAENQKVSYTVKVQTAEGGLEGVRVQACKGELCLAPVVTNATGVATIQLDKSENIADYHVKINKFPTGYAGNTATEYAFSEGATSLTISLLEYEVAVSDIFAGVANITVKIAKDGNEIATGKTDSRGGVLFLLDSDTYVATLTLPESYHLMGDVTSWELTETQRNVTVYVIGDEVTISKTVTVKDHNGNAKAGATVSLWTPDASAAVQTKTTDAEGKATFDGLNQLTNYSVSVTADGYTTQKTEFASFAATELEIVLPSSSAATEKNYTVAVKLTDGTTYTAAPITVTIVSYDSINETFTLAYHAQTQNGVASFTFVPSQTCSYYATVTSENLPNGYELEDQIDCLYGFAENAVAVDVELRVKPTYGTESDPAPWNNYSNVTNNPLKPVNAQMSVTLEAGQTYYIALAWSSEMRLTFTGDATVTYGENTYAAGDVIVFTEASPMQGNAQAVIAVTSVNGGTITLTTSPAGEGGGNTTETIIVKKDDEETGWGELIPFH